MDTRERVARELSRISICDDREKMLPNHIADCYAEADIIISLVGEEHAELVKALDNFGEHRRGCHKVYRHDTGECTCGLDAALGERR